LQFTYSEETYELQGAQCYGSLSQGTTGDGHYTAVCVCDGQLVLYNDLVESRDASLANKLLERCSLLVYASTLSRRNMFAVSLSINRAQLHREQYCTGILATSFFGFWGQCGQRFVSIVFFLDLLYKNYKHIFPI